MKYFTAKLYSGLNSRDPAVANSADDRWNRAEEEYECLLKRIRPRLSEAAKTLADGICLHDAEIIQFWQNDSKLVIWVGSERNGYVLRYRTVEPPKLAARRKAAPFSPLAVRWLYDEIDLPREGTFSHEILLSDGREIRVVFDDCLIVETHSLRLGQQRSGELRPKKRKKALTAKK